MKWQVFSIALYLYMMSKIVFQSNCVVPQDKALRFPSINVG